MTPLRFALLFIFLALGLSAHGDEEELSPEGKSMLPTPKDSDSTLGSAPEPPPGGDPNVAKSDQQKEPSKNGGEEPPPGGDPEIAASADLGEKEPPPGSDPKRGLEAAAVKGFLSPGLATIPSEEKEPPPGGDPFPGGPLPLPSAAVLHAPPDVPPGNDP